MRRLSTTTDRTRTTTTVIIIIPIIGTTATGTRTITTTRIGTRHTMPTIPPIILTATSTIITTRGAPIRGKSTTIPRANGLPMTTHGAVTTFRSLRTILTETITTIIRTQTPFFMRMGPSMPTWVAFNRYGQPRAL